MGISHDATTSVFGTPAGPTSPLGATEPTHDPQPGVPLREPLASQAAARVTGSPSRHGAAPANGRDLYDRASYAYDYVWYASERHQVLASRWDFLDTWSRLAVALAASLSAVSLFAENAALTATFAITTAVVSALNAAWEPSQRSALHRRAAREYGHLERPFVEMMNTVRARLDVTHYVAHEGHDSQGRPYDAGWYEPGEVPPRELKVLSAELAQCLDEMDAVEDTAPPLNRLFGSTPDGTPRTKLGLWRMKRQFKRQLEGTRIRAEFAEEARRLTPFGDPDLPPSPPIIHRASVRPESD